MYLHDSIRHSTYQGLVNVFNHHDSILGPAEDVRQFLLDETTIVADFFAVRLQQAFEALSSISRDHLAASAGERLLRVHADVAGVLLGKLVVQAEKGVLSLSRDWDLDDQLHFD